MPYGRIAAIGEITTTYGTYNNKTILQTIDNIICFCGRITSTGSIPAQATIFTVPTFAYPNVTVYIPLVIGIGGGYQIKPFMVTTAGQFACLEALSNCNIYLDGINYNINGKYYSTAKGNNDETRMTSPVTWK